MTLWHYTCDDGVRGILAAGGVIRPGRDGFVWMTDLEVPVRDALGLTSHSLDCDRTAHRFEIVGGDARSWMSVRREVPALAAWLEDVPGVMPRHWWVSRQPVMSTLNELERA